MVSSTENITIYQVGFPNLLASTPLILQFIVTKTVKETELAIPKSKVFQTREREITFKNKKKKRMKIEKKSGIEIYNKKKAFNRRAYSHTCRMFHFSLYSFSIFLFSFLSCHGKFLCISLAYD